MAQRYNRRIKTTQSELLQQTIRRLKSCGRTKPTFIGWRWRWRWFGILESIHVLACNSDDTWIKERTYLKAAKTETFGQAQAGSSHEREPGAPGLLLRPLVVQIPPNDEPARRAARSWWQLWPRIGYRGKRGQKSVAIDARSGKTV